MGAGADAATLGPGSKPSRARRIADAAIHQGIYHAIAEHHLVPGMKLPEGALAEVFGVSRTRIRKVLLDLSHDGVVTLTSNRGARVARPSVGETHDIFAIRRMLEAGIVRQLASNISSRQVADLRAFLERELAAHQDRDRRGAIRLSGEFHLRLAEAVDNVLLLAMMRSLVSRSVLAVAVYGAVDWSSCAVDEHKDLVRMIAAGEADAAAAAMDDHLRHVEASLNLDLAPKTTDIKAIFAHLLPRHEASDAARPAPKRPARRRTRT